MGLESKTSDALMDAGFESYWKNGISYVAGDRSEEDRNRIMDAANSILNESHEFYSWSNRSNDISDLYYNYNWCMKTRSIEEWLA